MKRAIERVCENPACLTHEQAAKPELGPSYATFTLSTAMNETKYCSLTCEEEVEGVSVKTQTQKTRPKNHQAR